eukprot:TRINITY_DN3454_c0_g1_i1.p1 TRINITY_DN3454_c0_g1~~TRINITY_DN3454_c0_g1_i1.p1  ORF type:complete len:1196 (-),score=217.43 TRINITY_DN3454_c0_g1_i1:63-3650(-)
MPAATAATKAAATTVADTATIPGKRTALDEVPLRLTALGTESLAIVSLPDAVGSAGKALDWLATALPSARNSGGGNGGLAALAGGGAISKTAVVVPEAALQVVDPPAGASVDHYWIALEVSSLDSVGNAPSAAATAAMVASLSAAGVRWRSIPSAQFGSTILVQQDDFPAATVALCRAGHAIGPSLRVCPPVPEEDQAAPERNAQYVGNWSLLRREETFTGALEEHTAGKGPLRLQSPSGLFIELRIPADVEDITGQGSCAGYHAVVDARDGRKLSVRHRTLDFRPPTGCVLCTQVKFDKEVLGELSHPRGRCRDEFIEAWTRLSTGPAAALELVAELSGASNDPIQPRRTGYWLFCGDRYARIVGLPRGEGVIAGTCCQSLTQLCKFAGQTAVREELRSFYEASWGRVEAPGRFRIEHDAWGSVPEGSSFYDSAAGVGGSICFQHNEAKETELVHRLPSGTVQRWRIRDWQFDPFTALAPGVAKPAAQAAASDSDSEASSSRSSSAPPPVEATAAKRADAVAAAAGAPAMPAAGASRSRSAGSASGSNKSERSCSGSSQAAKKEAQKKRSRSRRRKSSKPRKRSCSGSSASAKKPKKEKRARSPSKRDRKRRKEAKGKDREGTKEAEAVPQERPRRHRHRHRARRRSASKDKKVEGTAAILTPAPGAVAAETAAAPGAYPYPPYAAQAPAPAGHPARPPPGYPPPPGGRPPPRGAAALPVYPGAPRPGAPPPGPPPPGGMPPPPPGFGGFAPHGPWGPHRPPPSHPGALPPPMRPILGDPRAAGFAGMPPPGFPPHAPGAPYPPHHGGPPPPQAYGAPPGARGAPPPHAAHPAPWGHGLPPRHPTMPPGHPAPPGHSAPPGHPVPPGHPAPPAPGHPAPPGLEMQPPPPTTKPPLAAGAKTLRGQMPPQVGGVALEAAAPAEGGKPPEAPEDPSGVKRAATAAGPDALPADGTSADAAGTGAAAAASKLPPAPGAKLPPSPEDARITWLCQQFRVDATAESALRRLHPDLQRRVIEEGPIHAPDPSAEVLARVQRADAWGHQQVVSHFFANSGSVEPFVHEEFRRLKMDQQRQVMNFGPLRSGEPSKELSARVQEVIARIANGPGAHDRIAVFCRENSIDGNAEGALRQCSADIQSRVLEEGPVLATTNTSAVLMSRIRRAEGGRRSPTKRSRSRSSRKGASRSSSRSSDSDSK